MTSYPRPFAISVAPGLDGVVRIQVQGELDMSTSPEFDQILRREIAAGRRVVVDLSQTAFIDSTGLNALVTALRASDSNGGALKLSPTLPAQVERVLEITGLNTVLPIADESEDTTTTK
jgi:anti-sigma B factor antagonist